MVNGELSMVNYYFQHHFPNIDLPISISHQRFPRRVSASEVFKHKSFWQQDSPFQGPKISPQTISQKGVHFDSMNPDQNLPSGIIIFLFSIIIKKNVPKDGESCRKELFNLDSLLAETRRGNRNELTPMNSQATSLRSPWSASSPTI